MNENRRHFVVHLTTAWYWYLLAAILVIALWAFVFGLLDRIPYQQQINMFVAGYNIDKEQMEEQISELIKDEKIRQVTVDACTPGREETFHMVLATRGTVNTDMLILPEGTWPEEFLQGKAIGFNAEEIESYFSHDEYQYIEQDGVLYGICVYDAETEKTLLPESWIAFDADAEKRDYYLFFSAEADNVGTLGVDSEITDDQALKLLGILFQRAGEGQ